jgi:hypothetical protein
MKSKFSVHYFPKDFTLLGIQYDEGDARDELTNEVFSAFKISIGIGIVIFQMIFFNTKKGEK